MPMSMSMHTTYVRFEELEELVSPFWSMNETLVAMNGVNGAALFYRRTRPFDVGPRQANIPEFPREPLALLPRAS